MRATERNLKKSPSFTKENLFFFHETFGDLFFGLNVKTFPSVRRVAVILQFAEFNFYMRYGFSLRFLTAWLLFDYNSTLLPENSHVHCVIILSRN